MYHFVLNIIYLNREEFTEWRIDRAIAFKCHFCEAEYSIKHFGKINLALDIDRDLHIA
jgi:redox-regulated HSP33 family molecular chaperone